MMAFARLATFPCAVGVLILIAVVAPSHPKSVAASTFTVSKQADTADGTCDDDCSLREAILAANDSAEPDVISLPAGTYTLTIAGTDEDMGETGDLDIMWDLTINGAGSASTTIDAGGIDRAIDVLGYSPTVQINGVTVRGGNPAGQAGGGIHNSYGAKTTIKNSVVTQNTAAWGGGISSDYSGTVLVLEGVVVSHNTTTDHISGGGGIMNATGALTISASTISENNAAGRVGGIDNAGGAMTITNSTISGNVAGQDGGAVRTNVAATLDSVTIAGNTSWGASGGVVQTGNGTLTVKNSIIAGNSGQAESGDCSGTLTSQGHNLVQVVPVGCTIAGDTSGNLIGPDPLLGPLQDNGGPTPTRALLAGSPAIDTGSDTGCPDTDQRGYSRPADGDNSGPAVCDMGAFEVGAAPPTPTPTASPTPTPTEPPPQLIQGDVDCSGDITSVDALKELRYVAQISVSQTEPCPDIGQDVASFWGDVDCSGSVTSVDALKILRYVAQLSVSQTEPCPDIGMPEN